MAGVVLDTTVLIDVLRGDELARTWLAGLSAVPVCSEVSRVEIIRGLRSAERSTAERLFAGLEWAGLTEPIARLAGEFGRRHRASHSGIGLADLVVAATAQHLGTALATHNVRHFPMLSELTPPY